MKIIKLESITFQIDEIRTKEFYETQNGFVCDCPDCTNYISKIPEVLNSLNGIEKDLGIDLTKDVGQGMDELMPHDNDDHHLYVIPYYVVGKCYVDGKELEKQSSGSLWSNTVKKLTKNLSFNIKNTTEEIEIENAESILTIWFEYKTELINK